MNTITIIFVCVALFSSVSGFGNNDDGKQKGLPNLGELKKKIIQLIENLRDTNKPNFSPYNIDVHITDEQLESLGITAIHDADIRLNGTLDKILDFNVSIPILFPYKIKIKINIPEIDLNLHSYSLSAFLDLIKVYGDGELSLNLQNIDLDCTIKFQVHLNNSTIELKSADIKLDLAINDFKITGWLHDDVRSEQLTNLIKNHGTAVFNEFKDIINTKISNLVTSMIKDKPVNMPETFDNLFLIHAVTNNNII